MNSGNEPTAGAGEVYNYRNVRPLSTFAFAALAAVGALGFVAAAQLALVEATQDEVIADPPDLRRVLVAVEDRTGLDIPGARQSGEEGDRPATTVAVSANE